MTNQGITVRIPAQSELTDLETNSRVTNQDELTADFPDGIHIVKIGNAEYFIENIAVTDMFTTKLHDKYVLIPPHTPITLPPTTILQDLRTDGTVAAFAPPDCQATYMGSIHAPVRVPFVDLCKPVRGGRSRIIAVDSNGFITVTIKEKLVQTIYMKQCVGSEVNICHNGRYVYIRKCGILHDLETRQSTVLVDAYRICFSSDGSKIAYCSNRSNCDIYVMNMLSDVVTKVTNTLVYPTQISFYSDERFVCIANTEQIVIKEIQSGKRWKYMKSYHLRGFLVSVDGLINLKTSSQIKVWNPFRKNLTLRELATRSDAWSISGESLALSYQGDWQPYNSIQVYDTKSRVKLCGFETEKGSRADSLIFSPDRQFLMLTSATRSDVYAVSTGLVTATMEHSGLVTAVCWC